MDTPKNLFKQRLFSGETLIGLWLALADPYSAELCAGSGFDWLLVDGEHAPFDLRTTLATLQSVAPYPAHPVIRLPEGSPTLIKQTLDIGATTLLIPMVESPAQARDLVRATRYPPTGIRGVGSGIARSSRWTRFPNYVTEANDRICLLIQVESLTALNQLDEICAVAGVDGVFIGPADLSASMGYIGQPAHPNVVARIEAALRFIRKHGKAPGILCADLNLARRYIAAGAQFLAVGVDTSLLVAATRGLATAFGPSLTEDPAPPRAGY
ncbi:MULTISPECIES: 4-hydroxy-2-oxoheptanedioate aldolase [Paraburkholderia]|uniref:4-hydroxy-2-oxoheptanedioate aldolase n=1 Tax=Paraburkholderia dipogonis TaxID=1211383 RepID=A0A4Y8MGN9_9BURK|nr:MULTISPECIES: 4-hydroxy-2-oxoheptanedioate aldolase [Paraburkholderia]RKR31385.1 2,4-dihydroxyhept-2-enedioate aldolase [Paraburkholderia sp. BL17N1]TFE36656.1 4-hydroxy-2-oxoheptanedioate aldolase [Paraburkholderia dipogonis]